MRYNPVKTKMSGLVITTVLLIILSLSLFLFVVIRNNENEIISRSFRVLSQIGENIKAKDKTNFKVTANKWKKVNGKKDERAPTDSITREINGDTFLYKPLGKTIVGFEPIDPKDTITAINVNDLVSSLLRNDVFDEVIIRGTDKKNSSIIIYNSLGVDIRVDLKKNESIKKDTLIWEAGNMTSLEIGAIEYKCFTLPLKISDDNWWYVDGLISSDKFTQEKRGLDTWFTTLMILILVFLVLSFPVARLFLMSWLEHLQRNALLLISFSVCFGTSLIIMLLLALTSNYHLKKERENQLKGLAFDIENRFSAEIDSIYTQILSYDSLTGIIKFDSTALKSNQAKPKFYQYYKSFFWMDSTGMQLQEFGTRGKPKNLINLAHRDYFKFKDAWLLPSDTTKTSGNRFMLESIYSVTTGEALAAISKRSYGTKSFYTDASLKTIKTAKTSVAAISTPMHSVMDPVLPKGFSFSIIDREGKIVFHSNKKRNLQENFLEETNNNKKLLSAIYSKTDEVVSLKYQNNKTNVYIKPIANIPLYIITSQTKELANTYNSQVIASSLLFIILVFLFLGFHVLLFIITNIKRPELKGNIFALEWILPKKQKTGKYAGLLFINLLIFLFLILFHTCLSGLNFNMVDSFFIFLYSQIVLMELARQELKFNTKSVTIDAFLLITFIFLIVVNFVHSKMSIHYHYYLFFQIGILILFIVFKVFLFSKGFKKLPIKNFFEKNYFRIYQSFIMSWVLLIGILPSIIFYNNASQYEKRIGVKYQQLHLARELQKRNTSIDNYFTVNNINDIGDNYYRNLRKQKGIYTEFYFKTKIEKDKYEKPDLNSFYRLKNEKSKNKLFDILNRKDSLLSLLLIEKPLFNEYAVQKRKLAYNSSIDSLWFWKQNNDSLLNFGFTLNNIQGKDSVVRKSMYMKTSVPSYKFNGLGGLSSIFWLILIVVLISVFGLLGLILRKIFPFNKNYQISVLTFTGLLEKSLTPGYFKSKIFAINPSGESDGKIKLNVRKKGYKCIDVSSDPDFKEWMIKGDRIALLNFDEKIIDIELLKKKNDLLGVITRLKKKQVILSSKMTPAQIIAYYSDYLNKEDTDKKLIEKELARFSNLISQFQVIYCSLEEVKESTEEGSEIEKLLNKELCHDIFLHGLKKSILNIYKTPEQGFSRDEVILQIRDMAFGFYSQLWNSCTLEEKMILYDIARNSLINIKNHEVVRILKILMEKRLVIRNDYYKIMNLSFKNYILTNVDPLDLKEMDKLTKQNDAWQSFRIPLIIFASGIIIFLIATQQNFLNNLSTMLVSFGAIAGVFLKVSGVFSLKPFASKEK